MIYLCQGFFQSSNHFWWLLFGLIEKVTWIIIRWIRWLIHDYNVVFGQKKIINKQRCVSLCIFMAQKSWVPIYNLLARAHIHIFAFRFPGRFHSEIWASDWASLPYTNVSSLVMVPHELRRRLFWAKFNNFRCHCMHYASEKITWQSQPI